MANMFLGNQEKKIPKDFKECYKTDSITQNLWLWCERLEKWGFRICIALAVIGIFSIISNGIETAQLLDKLNIDMNEIKTASTKYGIEIKSVFEVIVEEIFRWSLYCFLEYCAYHILALLVGSLATIVQHIKITTNISLYNSAKAEGITDDYEEECEEKQEDNTKQSDYSKTLSKIANSKIGTTWECKKCGAKNPQNSISCKTCGNYK